MAKKMKKKAIKVKKAPKAAKKPLKGKKLAKVKPVIKPVIPRRNAKTAPPQPLIVMRRAIDSIPTVKPKEGAERPLTENQIQELHERLIQKRDELSGVVQRKKEQEIQVGEAEIGDEADIATRSVEKELLFETTDTEKQTLDMVEAALIKIEKGVYGRCESCQKPIPKMRLEFTPWARYCIPCQARLEIPSGE